MTDLETLYFGAPAQGHGHGQTPRQDQKTQRMCRQVQRRLDIALGGELSDPVLQGLWVESVVSEPGGTALLVTVVATDPDTADEVLTHLNAARGHLRSEVAAAINRKRTPHLHFIVVPPAVIEGPPSVPESGGEEAP